MRWYQSESWGSSYISNCTCVFLHDMGFRYCFGSRRVSAINRFRRRNEKSLSCGISRRLLSRLTLETVPGVSLGQTLFSCRKGDGVKELI